MMSLKERHFRACRWHGTLVKHYVCICVSVHVCAQPSKQGTPGKKAPEPAANGAVPPDSDAQPMATDEAAPDSLAFDPMAAPASRVDAVGTATPVEDFDALLARGLTDKAFEQLHAVVFKLVDTSFADRCAFALHSMQVFGALTNDFYTSLLYTSLGLPQTVFACGSPAQYAGLCHQPMQ